MERMQMESMLHQLWNHQIWNLNYVEHGNKGRFEKDKNVFVKKESTDTSERGSKGKFLVTNSPSLKQEVD